MHMVRMLWRYVVISLHWRHNGRDSVSNHQPHDCLLNRLFRRRSKKTSQLRVTGLCVGNSLGTGGFPAQMASNAENVSIWWRHHLVATDVADILRDKKGFSDINYFISQTISYESKGFCDSSVITVPCTPVPGEETNCIPHNIDSNVYIKIRIQSKKYHTFKSVCRFCVNLLFSS